MLSRLCGPRRPDPQQLHKVGTVTLARYRDAAAKFSDWLIEEAYTPCTADEWDDLLVEYKNDAGLSRSKFTVVVASVEWFFPRYRGRLTWSHDVLKGWIY